MTILSLILIFIENTVFLKGVVLITTLPFVSYVVAKKRNPIYLVLTYIFISLQTDRYLYNLLFIILYILFNKILLINIEYTQKTLIYLLLLQSFFYVIFNFKLFELKYFILNILGFIVCNYIYTRFFQIKDEQ